MDYKKYRIFLNTSYGNFIVATSNTVNDLVDLVKYWMERTTDGMYLPDDAIGVVSLQVIDKTTGAYANEERLEYRGKSDIITQVRKLGAR